MPRARESDCKDISEIQTHRVYGVWTSGPQGESECRSGPRSSGPHALAGSRPSDPTCLQVRPLQGLQAPSPLHTLSGPNSAAPQVPSAPYPTPLSLGPVCVPLLPISGTMAGALLRGPIELPTKLPWRARLQGPVCCVQNQATQLRKAWGLLLCTGTRAGVSFIQR